MSNPLIDEKSDRFPWKKLILMFFTSAFFFMLGAVSGLAILIIFGDFPSLESPSAYRPSVTSKIFDRNNQVIGEIFIERRTLVPYKTISPYVIKAFVAAEDAHFFKHKGVDLIAITRALVKDVFSGEFAQGGSTITQQMIKSLFLTPEKKIKRKVKEVILAYRIEKKMSKEDILYLYLNQIYLGDGAYGVEAASQTYFGKSVASLNLAESALLAGITQAPSRYSPRNYFDKAKARQRYVLRRMTEEKIITADEAEKAYNAPIVIAPPPSFKSKADYFLEYIRLYLQDRYGMETVNRTELRIYTTIDKQIQTIATDTLREGVRQIEERNNYEGLQGALLCLDPHTGGVLAMVGGVDFAASQFNRALQARRQPGSAFKPIIYGAALDKGKTVISTVYDSPIELERSNTILWKPKNYDGTFLGPITLLEAMAKSRNIATVRLLSEIGVDSAIRMAQNLGITSPIERNLSIALGSLGVTPLELVTAYSTIANSGQRPTPFFIWKVQDATGNILEQAKPQTVPAISPETAYLTVRLMQEVLRSGTGAAYRKLSPNLAGKTGTTNENTDAWFVGGSPDMMTAVWIGFDTPKSLGGRQSAALVALPVWGSFMQSVLTFVPDRSFPVPAGIAFAKIDPATGKTLLPDSPSGVILPFKLGTIPERANQTAPPSLKKTVGDELL
ncbi:MAG: PBP1A family penicillin-binding protein [Syntrophorhabdaceae bacterium]|nr:PBP1A family penicillin-binding protein [Syntrophorhabdaceae bacterium]